MPECAGNRFSEDDDFEVVLSKGNPEESSCQKHYRWMAHWIKARSSSEHQDGKCNIPLEDAKNGTCIKDSGTSHSEFMKSRMAERLMLGRNHERTSLEHAPQLNSNMLSVTHDAYQEDQHKKIGSFPSSVMQMQRDDNPYGKTVVSEAFSISRLSELSLDFQELVNSDNNLNSQWTQFPVFTTNHKMDSVLNPRRRHATATVSDPSNLIAFSSQEYELLFHQITEGIMDQCKPPGGIIPPEGPSCLCYDPAGKKFKDHLPTTVSRSRSKLAKDHLLNTQRIESAADATDSCIFPDPTADVLTVNSEGDAVAHQRQPVDRLTDSRKQKGPCLFEMLTVPSKSQSAFLTDSVCLCGAQNQFSAKTETLHRSKSSAGITSSLVRKEIGGPHKRKSEQLATLSMKESSGYNKENRFPNGNVNQDVSSKATLSSQQDFCMPGTETMDLDTLPFQLTRVRNQIPNDAIHSPTPPTELRDRWLKRLLLDVTHPHVPGSSKRLKVLDEGVKLRKISPAPAKSVHCWVGRLCQGGGTGAPVPPHEDPDQRKRVAKTELGSGEHEGQFPRIAAMAMMGRAMSKIRPFAHRKKGPCVIWNTQGA